MKELPKDFRYTQNHQWVKVEENNLLRIGITDFAQQQLGDLVYVDLPQLGRVFYGDEQCAVVESVKTASDLTSPVTGEIVAVNGVLVDEPERVNESPYEAWIYCVKADDLSPIDYLMDSQAYLQFIEQ